MNANNLQEMTVKVLRAHIEQEGFKVVGAWKVKKEDLIRNIIYYREIRQLQLATNRMRQEEEIVQINDESRKTRKNENTFVVILEDGIKLMFDSNKEFAEYFNTKHNTNFRSDIAWYIARDRNEKAKQIFRIKEII